MRTAHPELRALYCECGRPLNGRRFYQGCAHCAGVDAVRKHDPVMTVRRAKGRPQQWDDTYDLGAMVDAGADAFWSRRGMAVPKDTWL